MAQRLAISCVLILLLSLASARVGAPIRVLDAHVHITTPNLNYTWAVPPSPPLSCPCVFNTTLLPCGCEWSPAMYADATSTFASTKVVFIEVAANPNDWLNEAQWASGLAHAGTAPIASVVAHSPPGFGVANADEQQLAADFATLSSVPFVVGVRGALNYTDPSLQVTNARHFGLLAAQNLSLDVNTPINVGDTATNLAALAAAFPDSTIILDHMGSPPIDSRSFNSWVSALRVVAAQPNVVVKLGGLLQYFHNAGGVLPTADVTTPFIVEVVAAFGWGRVLYEANWFFCNWPGRLDVASAWLPLLDAGLRASNPPPGQPELDAFYWGNGVQAYRVVQ